MPAPGLPPPPVADRASHPFHTHDMICEIPAALRQTLAANGDVASRLAARMVRLPTLIFTGCGTAFFSAWLGQQFASAAPDGRLSSVAIPALELSSYPSSLGPACGVLGVSHSGITKATVDALRHAREAGAFTIGITHFRDRPIEGAVDATVLAGNGPDVSRCHTKCYVTSAAAAAQIALAWRGTSGREPAAGIDRWQDALEELPSLVSEVLRSTEPVCQELATAHLSRRATYILGAGPNAPTAAETALKLKETSFVPAEGLETEQALHGPWVAFEPQDVVFLVAPKGRTHGRAVDCATALQRLGVPLVAVVTEGDREMPPLSDTTIALPEVDELLSPFLNIIPLYLYAYWSSVRRGHNPDLLRYPEPAYWAARNLIFPPGTH